MASLLVLASAAIASDDESYALGRLQRDDGKKDAPYFAPTNEATARKHFTHMGKRRRLPDGSALAITEHGEVWSLLSATSLQQMAGSSSKYATEAGHYFSPYKRICRKTPGASALNCAMLPQQEHPVLAGKPVESFTSDDDGEKDQNISPAHQCSIDCYNKRNDQVDHVCGALKQVPCAESLHEKSTVPKQPKCQVLPTSSQINNLPINGSMKNFQKTRMNFISSLPLKTARLPSNQNAFAANRVPCYAPTNAKSKNILPFLAQSTLIASLKSGCLDSADPASLLSLWLYLSDDAKLVAINALLTSTISNYRLPSIQATQTHQTLSVIH